MRDEFENLADLDTPLARALHDDEPEEPDLDRELLQAADAEFREAAVDPGLPQP